MINMDKKTHKFLTLLLYVVFGTGYLIILLGNEGIAVIPLSIYTVIVGLLIFSHIKYYRYDGVDPKGKIVLIVNVLLTFVFLYVDQSPLEQYFLLVLIADCIFAYSRAFSLSYVIGIYVLFYPYMIHVVNRNTGGYIVLDFLEDMVISIFCTVIFFMLKSQIMVNVKYNALLIESNESYEQLEKYSIKVEELAIVEERNRIALILHNSIGHSLTSMMLSLQAEKMELISKKQLDKEAFSTVEKLIQEAMSLLRRTIESADDFMKDMPFDELMDMFIREASNNTRVAITYTANNTSYVKDDQKGVIFNVVIESITNAMKHSGCEQIEVSIEGYFDKISVSVWDDGCGFESIEYGYGLTKMKEQVKQLGGSYELISNEGCKTTVILPNKEVTSDVR